MNPYIAGLLLLGLAGLLIVIAIYRTTYRPLDGDVLSVVCRSTAPQLAPGQLVKVLTYNVQFMAGKDYVFFFDVPDFSRGASRPSPAAIQRTLAEVARVITAEDPDVILLQEVDEGARRTDYADQLAQLLALLPESYACHTATFYWKAAFIPHPRILGSVGLKLAIVSKYRVSQACRRNLAPLPVHPLIQAFVAQRAILEASLPIRGGGQLHVMNTHLEAFAANTNICARQVAQVKSHLDALDEAQAHWVIGGDFNLLPDGQYAGLHPSHRSYYNPLTEMSPLYSRFNTVPSQSQAVGPDASRWFTYFGNDPVLKTPDRTLDYLLYSRTLRLIESHVRQADTRHVSDHFPVVATFQLP